MRWPIQCVVSLALVVGGLAIMNPYLCAVGGLLAFDIVWS